MRGHTFMTSAKTLVGGFIKITFGWMEMLNRDVWWGADFVHVDIHNVYFSSTFFVRKQPGCVYVGLVEAYSTIL